MALTYGQLKAFQAAAISAGIEIPDSSQIVEQDADGSQRSLQAKMRVLSKDFEISDGPNGIQVTPISGSEDKIIFLQD
jgi:hypothetical protein